MKLTEPKEKGRRFAPLRFKLEMGVFGGGVASYIPFVAQPGVADAPLSGVRAGQLRRLSRPALVRRCQRTGSVGWLAHPPLLLAASPALGLLSTMVMSLLAPGASSARAAGVPRPRARAAVKRASCLIEVSFQTGLGGIRWGAGRFDGHLVAARFSTEGERVGWRAVRVSLHVPRRRGKVGAGEGCLPGRSTNFDLGFCFC